MHSPQSARVVLDVDEIGRSQVALVGGKAANLGELARFREIRVPRAVCVTTLAFDRIVADEPSIAAGIARLSRLNPDDRDSIRAISAIVREAIECVVIPDDVATAVADAVATLGEDAAFAVRSSATAEDLPATSFAGQHDTYLNVRGTGAVLHEVRRCWASLFTERAVAYRARNRIAHDAARMAVVVQRMVAPAAAGVMFTADPVTSNRRVVTVEASFGLGEALVAGRVNADVYQVRAGAIVDRTIGTKAIAVRAARGGGTMEVAIAPQRQAQPALTDAQVLRLAELGRRIESRLGGPQDIEWCLADDGFHILQSRPITTLFPIPATGDDEPHVFVSVGHQQMMTDAMRPLGASVWQLLATAPMYQAAGRMFVDVAERLASPASQEAVLTMLTRSDPLIGDALRTIVDRGDVLPPAPEVAPSLPPGAGPPVALETDPRIVAELVERSRASVAALESTIGATSGAAALDAVLGDIAARTQTLFDPRSLEVVVAGIQASWWLNDHLHEWLGETNPADTLAQSAPGNVTSEMGLALLDVADAIRPHPDVVAFLRAVDGDEFVAELAGIEGGTAARDAIEAYLDEYGARCVGEIDITRPRWRERPSTLLPAILANVANFGAGERARRVERGHQEATAKELELLERLRDLPDGEEKADATKRMIDRLRTFAGYREYPKYAMVRRLFVYKHTLMREAERLAQDGVLQHADDAFFLTFEELHDAVRTRRVDEQLIRQRAVEFASFQELTPPRVMTSDGEVVTGSYRHADLPPGVLAGLPVSAGTVEGRARVVTDLADATLEPGDILVTAYTDPGWSAVFVAIAGLVTEVGGSMSHGAVITREYGLPAVVGVQHATALIPDGQRIRVDGTHGYVELLPPLPAT